MDVVNVSAAFFNRKIPRNQKPKQSLVDDLIWNLDGGGTVPQFSQIKYRPVHARPVLTFDGLHPSCRHCMPQCRGQITSNMKNLATANAFNLQKFELGLKPDDNELMCPSIRYYWKCTASFPGMSPSITPQQIRDDPKLKDLMTEGSQRKGSQILNPKALLSYIKAFGVAPSLAILRHFWNWTMGWLGSKVFSSMFKSINFQWGQIRLLKSYQKTGHPLVFIPLTRSILDVFIINWLLLRHGLVTPYFFMSNAIYKSRILLWLSKRIGGLGCQMKAQEGTEKPVAMAYMSQIMMKTQNVIVPLEPKRSRNGMPSTIIVGSELLEVPIELFLNGILEDVFFVPLSVTYEKLPEESFLYEDSGFSLWRLIRSCLGSVRVDFAQPFGMRDMRNAFKGKISWIQYEYNVDEAYCATASRYDYNYDSDSSTSPIYPQIMRNDIDESTVGWYTNMIGNHALYNAMMASALTPSNILAFIMLRKFKEGAPLSKVIKKYGEMVNLVSNEHSERFRQLAFKNMNKEQSVGRALLMLGSSVIVELPPSTGQPEVLLKPVLNSRGLQILQYYANNFACSLALDAVIAISIMHLVTKGGSMLEMNEDEMSFPFNDLTKVCHRAYKCVRHQFFLHAPCLQMHSHVRMAIAHWELDSLLKMKRRDDRYRNDYEFSDPEDYEDSNADEVTFLTTKYACEKISMLKSILVPYFEIYVAGAEEMFTVLTKEDLPENILKQLMIAKVRNDENNIDKTGEVNVEEAIVNYLQSMKDKEVIYPLRGGIVTLSKKYAKEDYLDSLTDFIIYDNDDGMNTTDN